jgi:type II secretory pathway component PulM
MNWISAMRGFWLDCSGRERAALAIAAAVALAAVLYAFLWEPGLAARKRLSGTLPVLRAQLESMRLQESEIAALRKKLAAAPQRGDLASVLKASAAGMPFAKAVQRIEPLANGGARVTGADLEFDALLAWIEALQRELGIRVEACSIAASDRPGLVRVEVTFQWSGTAAGRRAP